MPISQELLTKIDVLTDEKLKARILRVLNSPGKKVANNEQIFENMVSSHQKVEAQRVLWRKWGDDEVAAFVEYFKHEMPEDYADFLKQERENNEIDDDLWWRVGRLAEKWIPDAAEDHRASASGFWQKPESG